MRWFRSTRSSTRQTGGRGLETGRAGAHQSDAENPPPCARVLPLPRWPGRRPRSPARGEATLIWERSQRLLRAFLFVLLAMIPQDRITGGNLPEAILGAAAASLHGRHGCLAKR